MKIVKSFSDSNFFIKNYALAFETEEELNNGIWLWGLGDDGYLYCQSSDFEDPVAWYEWSHISGFKIDLRDMKKVVKEFGHLLVWL